MAVRKISASIPEDLVIELDRMSRFLGVSRSTVIVGLLQPALEQTSVLLDALPSGGGEKLTGQEMQRAAYDRIAHLELLLEGLSDDARKLQ